MSRSSAQSSEVAPTDYLGKRFTSNDLSPSNEQLKAKKGIDRSPVFCYIARLKLSTLEISTSSIRLMCNYAIATEINNIQVVLQVRQETAN